MNGYGYMGKMLYIDLNKNEVIEKKLSKDLQKHFIGGTGLAAAVLSEYNFKDINPLDEQSPIVFSTGPLTGTKVPTSGRYAVAAKSPLTGIWGESDSGGRFGISLKSAGYDTLIITGKASVPSILIINDKKIEIKPSKHLWGKDTYETWNILNNEYKNSGILCIGQAGEKLLPMSSIMTEGHHARAAGRCGMGAIMGSKNIKAIVAFGQKKVRVFNQEALTASIKLNAPKIIASTKGLHDGGTARGVLSNAILGDMSAYNWKDGDCSDEAKEIDGKKMQDEFFVSRYYCPTCITGCGRIVKVTTGKFSGTESAGPEYETIAGFGAQSGCYDLAKIIEINDLCNRYGIDTMSTSGAINFLIECIEKGYIAVPKNKPKLHWGNSDAVISLIHDMINGDGLGTIASNGVYSASENIGEHTRSFSMHVKGLEFSYHDPRALYSLAIAYATNPRGACHRACTHNLERKAFPSLGYSEALDRHKSKGKGKATAVMQNFSELFNCLKLCQFHMNVIDLNLIRDWLNMVTGWDITNEELLKVGERNQNLKRLLNCSCGITSKDDKLPDRIMKEPFTTGSSANKIPDLKLMLKEYYDYRGWDEDGRPSQKKLNELDLTDYKNMT